MPTITLTDKLGLDVDAQFAPRSTLLKYLEALPHLKLESLDLSKVGGLTLDEPAVKSFHTGVSFADPISLGVSVPSLTVGAGAHGSFELITDAGDLPGHDDDADIPADNCYFCFGVQASASTDVSASAGILTFGAGPSTKVDLASCIRLPLKAGVTLIDAIRQTVGAFAVSANCDDMASLAAGQITKVGVHGALTFSGTANLLAVTNPLAAATLPAPLPVVSVSAGGSITVGATCTLETDYDVVVRKLDNGAVRLGWFRKKGATVSVDVSAGEGISAGTSETDLFSRLIAVISANATADLKELAAAEVPDGQAASIQSAVKAAANRQLQIALDAELSESVSASTFFLYEIDLGALTPESRSAVEQALRGNLTAIHKAGLPGITLVRSVWEKVRSQDLEFDVNLLGILNYRSVTSLALEGRVLVEETTGALVITDEATAERIESTTVNFGADPQKLRHVLAESFLITAAYHGARQVISTASLKCSHSFFELDNSTSARDMAHKLRTAVALNLLTEAEAQLPAGVNDFGRTLCCASADYDDSIAERLFLDSNGVPLAHELYENAGRAAIQMLVKPGDTDEVRRRPAIEDPLWNRMKDVGQPSFPSLFVGIPTPFVGAITADYTTIQWWADAMVKTGQQLAKMRLWMAQHPNVASDNPDFQRLRQELAGFLRNVAANTREEFGDPWGLIAMNQLAGRTAPAKFTLTGPQLVISKRRALTADQSART